MSSDSLAPAVPLGGHGPATALHDAWVVTLRNQCHHRCTLKVCQNTKTW